MNIFNLHEDTKKSAQMHCDKHVVKMIIEYAQLMSTAHRLLDGEMYLGKTANGRNIKRWRLDDEREDILYKASHINHPSAIWVRESIENYYQMFKLYMATLAEFTNRYGKIHGASKPSVFLMRPPLNIPCVKRTEIPQCMPDYCKVKGNPIKAYRNYYINEKESFATWKNKEIPQWFKMTSAQSQNDTMIG
jgi:predicted DNA-binding protein